MIRTSTCWVKAKEIEFTSVNGEAAENSPHFLAKKIKSVVFPDSLLDSCSRPRLTLCNAENIANLVF